MRVRAALLVILLCAIGSAALAQRHTGPVRHTGATAAPAGDASAPTGDAATDGSADGAATGQSGSLATSFDIPMPQRGAGAITHYPIPEQLARNDIPVFVQVRSSAPIDHVSLFYRASGGTRFREVRMNSVGQDVGLPGGYGAAVPCEDSFPPSVEYFVQALDTSGAVVGTAGESTRPIHLPIVTARTYNIVPTLPGQGPPRNCGTIDVAATPTNGTHTTSAGGDAGTVEQARGTADLGEPCAHDRDCANGLRCGSARHCVFVHAQ